MNKSTTNYYEEKIKQLFLQETATALWRSEPPPKPRLLCLKSKDHLGDIYTSLMRVLLMIRDNKKVFTFLGKIIDKDKDLNEKFVEFLADDIIFFLFADFSTPEKFVIRCLSQLETLMQVIF